MQTVKFREAVKMDSPYFLCGDAGSRQILEDEVAFWASTQGLVHIEANALQQFAAPEVPDSHGTLQKLDDDTPAKRALDGVEEPVKRPYGNAPKSAWIKYAMSQDPELTQERAESMSKNDLMAKHGERL